MRALGHIVALGLVFAVVVTTAEPQNVSVADYEVPVSRAQSLTLDMTYGYERLEQDTLANNATALLNYDYFYESLPFAYSTTVSGTWSRTWDNGTFQRAYRSDASGRVKKYVWNRRDAFGSVVVHGSYQKGQDRPAIDAVWGVGWGRFIDATALRRAVRLDDFLLSEGVTSGRMPKQTMLNVAQIIARQSEYRQRYGAATYRRFWYDDIETAVQGSGLLTQDALGVLGSERLEEVLFRENVGDRFYGYDVTLGVRYDLLLPTRGARRPTTKMDLNLRYARPVRWDTQISHGLRLNSALRAGEFARAVDLSATTGFLYELTNRVDLNMHYRLALQRAADSGNVTASHEFTPTFLYYIENEVRLLATLRVLKTMRGAWDSELAVALNYKAF
jgi:hypothetical protein